MRDFDSIFDIVHVEVCMHVVVEEVAGFIVGETTDIVVEPLREGFAL